MDPVVTSALVAAAVGLAGTAGVLALARRSVVWAAVAGPFVVVASLAAGIVTSVRTMALPAADTTTILLVLAATVPVALAAGLVLGRQLHRRNQDAARAEAERERDRRVEAHRRELVSWIAHDLRTPLAGMRAVIEAAQDGVVEEPGDYLARLHDGTVRLGGMIDDLLALSRLQAPGRALHTETVSLTDLVSDVIAHLRPVADRAGIRLEGVAAASVEARLDAREVTRAVTNLVENALRHTPAGESVTVRVADEGGTAVVGVADACGGIPPDHLAHVFEPGWRGTEARGSNAGAGLGLAIVREVAHGHGGVVRVRNSGPGCVFELRLPGAGRSA